MSTARTGRIRVLVVNPGSSSVEVDTIRVRVVYGDAWFTGPVAVDGGAVRDRIAAPAGLAPLLASAAGLDWLLAADITQPVVDYFDTVFQGTLPAEAAPGFLGLELRDGPTPGRTGRGVLQSRAYARR